MRPYDATEQGHSKAKNIGSESARPAAEQALEPKEKLTAPSAGPSPGEGTEPGPVGPDNGRYIFGPDGAEFDEPPPDNAEPPEPDEEVGEKLTERQLAFCDHYVECPVATRAARKAGYASATAAKKASRLLKNRHIMRRILELRRKHHLEQAYRRETLLDKFEVVFAESIERRDFHAAIQALTMQARLARIDEAMPGVRYYRRFERGGEQLVWDALTRLEQKLTEIAVGDFPGAAAAVPATPFEAGAVAEAFKARDGGSAEQRAAWAVEDRRRRPRQRR